MPNRCVIKHCNGKAEAKQISIFSFPKNESVRQLWASFVKTANREWDRKTDRTRSTICSQHFMRDDFTNYEMFRMGLSTKLCLKKAAVPSIFTENVLRKLQLAEVEVDDDFTTTSPDSITKSVGILHVPLTVEKGIQCNLSIMQLEKSTQISTNSSDAATQTDLLLPFLFTSIQRKRMKADETFESSIAVADNPRDQSFFREISIDSHMKSHHQCILLILDRRLQIPFVWSQLCDM
ncbi:unnamed protein product [Clavelina lepadiformis]|uniref:THAP-type domain-containing protein n=1 Tax=Clavelina lepadiformis TaxID=159417 RepID=A0ABP0FIG6_CLALP